MVQLPDRLAGLVGKLERGEVVTIDELDRTAALQALDLARAGRQFATEAIKRDEELAERLRDA